MAKSLASQKMIEGGVQGSFGEGRGWRTRGG
jgi:hypothetical protein